MVKLFIKGCIFANVKRTNDFTMDQPKLSIKRKQTHDTTHPLQIQKAANNIYLVQNSQRTK